MTKEELREKANQLLEEADICYLTTIDSQGFPNTRAVFNLRHSAQFPLLAPEFSGHRRDLMVYLTTNTSSKKVEQIRKNPNISIYYCLREKFHGMMLVGRCEIVDDPVVKQRIWQDGWEIYYPKGVADEDYSILSLKPLWAKGWYGENAFEFRLDDTE